MTIQHPYLPDDAPIVAFVAALNARQEVGDLGTAAILSKPFDIDDLLTAVRSHLPLAM